MFFWLKSEGVILYDGSLSSKKSRPDPFVLSEGEWFPYLFSVLRKISYKLEKIQIFLKLSIAQKTGTKKLNVTFSLKLSLQNTGTNYETMDSVSGLVPEI